MKSIEHLRAVARLDLQELTLSGTQILGPLSFTVEEQETVAILGPSGIGKTSLLRILAGFETRFKGHLTGSRDLAYVFQEPTLMPWRSSLANLTLATGCSAEAAKEWLDAVGLADKAAHFPGQLSLGQQRRLALARAFAARPRLLLMDEPFVSLDEDLLGEMMDVFDELRRRHQTTTILVTHSRQEVMRLATRVVTLSGAPATIASELSVASQLSCRARGWRPSKYWTKVLI